MNTVKLVKLLNLLNIYNSIRALWDNYHIDRSKVREFYQQIISQGELCFDIGANIGFKTSIFLSIGTHVIAVEPTPECISFLKKRFRNHKNLTVVPKAVDSTSGSKILHLCESNALASLSEEWIDSSVKSFSKGFTWNKSIAVQTTTLDELIKLYGKPVFIKIDVEGYELNALLGLSEPIQTIAFEYIQDSSNHVEECISKIASLGSYRFNITCQALPCSFDIKNWLTSTEMLELLKSAAPSIWYGEIYATLKETNAF